MTERREMYETHFRRMWPERHDADVRGSLRTLTRMLRRAKKEEAEAWASRVDSETLAAALSMPSDSATRRAAAEEWTQRVKGEAMKSKFDDLTAAEKAALEDAARPLWSALEDLGWVDGHGGSEFGRVFPETIDFVHGQANPSL